MSYTISRRRRSFGDDVGPGACQPGEEFDLASMQCVTAGQAVTPMPTAPANPPPFIKTLPGTPIPGNVNPPQVQVPAAPVKSDLMTFLPYGVGAIFLVTLAVVASR